MPTLFGMWWYSVPLRLPRLISRAFSALAALLVAACALLAAPSQAESGVVGRVSLAVGAIHRVGADGLRTPLKLGDVLRERDRIVTGADALAMIVFVDQGRLALRPETEVWIKAYRIDPSGADTQLELELMRGTVRQISGRAAQAQPERYRLNTPIAAIGVRGTDFLARAAGADVSTYVHEGAIVIQPPVSACPLIARCPIWAFSSASDAGALLQVQANGQVRRFNAGPEDVERIFGVKIASVLGSPAAPAATSPSASPSGSAAAIATGPASTTPAGASQASGHHARAGAADPSHGGQTSSSSGVGAAASPAVLGQGSAAPIGTGADLLPAGYSGLTSLSRPSAVLNALASVVSTGGGGATGTVGPGSNNGVLVSSGGGGGVQAAPATAVGGAPPVEIAPVTGLVWARAGTASPLAGDFSMLRSVEAAQQNRQITVGDVGVYNLWRTVVDPSPFTALVGRFSFGLAASEARFTSAAGLSGAVTVDRASRLDINFDTATFNTQLLLGGAGVPAATLLANGSITTAGLFSSRSADGQQALAGALTLDGREAGYFFNMATADGRYQGITLWGLPIGAAAPAAANAGPSVGTVGAAQASSPAIAPGLATLPLPAQLVWGRFSTPSDIPVTLALPFEQASAGRQVTVGEVGQYALWRATGAGGLVTGLKGEFTFGLSAGQAFYTPAGGAAAVATINQASLGANFDTATFNTRLLLGGGDVPLTWLEASGRITEEGLFTSRNSDGSRVVAGAFTANAKEAGYLFKMATRGGQFQGITLWGRKP